MTARPAERAAERFLVRAAELLHRRGTPAHRLERVLGVIAQGLGIEASFFSTPTSLFCALGSGDERRTHLVRVEPGEIDLGKLVEFDGVLEDVEHGRADLDEGLRRLEEIEAAPPRWSTPAAYAAWGGASAGAAVMFGGDAFDAAASFVLGAAIHGLARVLPRHPASVGLLEPVAAFLAAAASIGAAALSPSVDHRLVTLAALIVLVPGLTLTVGMTELATRHLASGTARLAGAATVFLMLLLGVALAWGLAQRLVPDLFVRAAVPGPALPLLPAVLLAPLCFAVLLEVRVRELPIVLVTGWLGFAATRLGQGALGPDVGALLGALTVGLASNAYARALDRPALVPLTPGILLLVPGSLGYRSLTAFLLQEAESER